MKKIQTHTIELYQGKNGYYLRVRAKNGKIVLDGGEAYSTKTNCKRAAHRLLNTLKSATLKEL